MNNLIILLCQVLNWYIDKSSNLTFMETKTKAILFYIRFVLFISYFIFSSHPFYSVFHIFFLSFPEEFFPYFEAFMYINASSLKFNAEVQGGKKISSVGVTDEFYIKKNLPQNWISWSKFPVFFFFLEKYYTRCKGKTFSRNHRSQLDSSLKKWQKS